MENEIKFPHYCCFGKLQGEPVLNDSDEITAVYLMFGRKVHELTYNKVEKFWILRSFAPDGTGLLYSCYPALDKTVSFHMNHGKDKDNPLLDLLRSELLKLGSVWFEHLPDMDNGEQNITYSPAGKLLAVRLLLSAGGDFSKQIDTLRGLFEYEDPESRLRLKIHEFYETSCIITKTDTSAYWHLAFVAEYIVPLAFVYDAVKLFHDRGMLNRNSIDQVFV